MRGARRPRGGKRVRGLLLVRLRGFNAFREPDVRPVRDIAPTFNAASHSNGHAVRFQTNDVPYTGTHGSNIRPA